MSFTEGTEKRRRIRDFEGLLYCDQRLRGTPLRTNGEQLSHCDSTWKQCVGIMDGCIVRSRNGRISLAVPVLERRGIWTRIAIHNCLSVVGQIRV